MSTLNYKNEKYKKKVKDQGLTKEEFERDLEAGEYGDPYSYANILKSITGA